MKNVRLADEEKFPWELIEEILSRVPPKSLVCFRTVSKKWNALFEDKTFLNSHKSTFRFVLTTKSKFYSVSIDPEIVVRELALDIPGLGSEKPKKLVDCNVLLICRKGKRAVVWNPWLKQSRVIKAEVSQIPLDIDGIGYDRNKGVKESGYKTIACYWKKLDPKTYWTFYDFATDAWIDVRKSESSDSDQDIFFYIESKYGVSLNGNMYWVTSYDNTDPLYLDVHEFDFSRDCFSKGRSTFVAKAMPRNKED